MNESTVLLQDSEVAAIEVLPETVVVRFAVACLRRAVVRPGEAREGYLPGLQWVCEGARVLQHDAGCVGRLADGSLGMAGSVTSRLPLALETTGEARLELVFANGARFRAQALRVVLRGAHGSAVFEDYAC